MAVDTVVQKHKDEAELLKLAVEIDRKRGLLKAGVLKNTVERRVNDCLQHFAQHGRMYVAYKENPSLYGWRMALWNLPGASRDEVRLAELLEVGQKRNSLRVSPRPNGAPRRLAPRLVEEANSSVCKSAEKSPKPGRTSLYAGLRWLVTSACAPNDSEDTMVTLWWHWLWEWKSHLQERPGEAYGPLLAEFVEMQEGLIDLAALDRLQRELVNELRRYAIKQKAAL